MGDHECINTELGLAIEGNSTYSKYPLSAPHMKAEEQERPLHKEELMVSTGKKLRLTKEQSDFLEDSYRDHNNLTSIQKAELAEKLNLRPQQVEVWFQNRRAREKIKQIKKDCEYLKKLCDDLRDENQRLKIEILELRTLRANQI